MISRRSANRAHTAALEKAAWELLSQWLSVTCCESPAVSSLVTNKQVTKPQIIPHWLTHPCCRQSTCVIRHQWTHTGPVRAPVSPHHPLILSVETIGGWCVRGPNRPARCFHQRSVASVEIYFFFYFFFFEKHSIANAPFKAGMHDGYLCVQDKTLSDKTALPHLSDCRVYYL